MTFHQLADLLDDFRMLTRYVVFLAGIMLQVEQKRDLSTNLGLRKHFHRLPLFGSYSLTAAEKGHYHLKSGAGGRQEGFKGE